MLSKRRPSRKLGVLLVLSVCGCMVPKGQLNTCQTQNRALAEKNAALQAEVENLRTHRDQLVHKLQQAEEEVALVRQENELIRRRLALREQAIQTTDSAYGASPMVLPADSRVRLEQLAKRFPSLGLNPQNGQCQLLSERLFPAGQSQLSSEAEGSVRGLIQVLQSPEGKELRVWIVAEAPEGSSPGRSGGRGAERIGSLAAQQALALKEKLCQMGLPSNRVGLAAVPSSPAWSNSSGPQSTAAGCQLKVFLVPPEVPIIGWLGQESQRF